MGRRTECIGSIRIDAFIKISGAFSDDLRTYCYGWRRLFLYRKCKTDAVKAAVSEAAGDRILCSSSNRLSYVLVNIGFLLLTLFFVHFGEWFGAASFIPLSVALYLLVVWIGNIHASITASEVQDGGNV